MSTEFDTTATDSLDRAEQELATGNAYTAREFLRYYKAARRAGGAQPVNGDARAMAAMERAAKTIRAAQ